MYVWLCISMQKPEGACFFVIFAETLVGTVVADIKCEYFGGSPTVVHSEPPP